MDAHERLEPRITRGFAGVLAGAGIGALGALACALLLATSDAPVYAPLLAAVAVAVWATGPGGTVACIVAGWTLAAWAVTEPRLSFHFGSSDDLVRWESTLAIGVVIGLVGYVMRRGQARAARIALAEERTRVGVERLQSLAASLSAAVTVEEVARVLVDEAPLALGAGGAVLALLDRDELVVVDARGPGGRLMRPGERLALNTRAPVAAAVRRARPVWAQQREDFAAWYPDGARLVPSAAGALGMPVFEADRLAGGMEFLFGEPWAVTADVRGVARLAVELGGQALERAGLYEQERSSRAALDRILAVAPRFQRGAEPLDVVVSICAEARRTFGCDVVQMWAPVDDEELEVTWRDPPSNVIPPGTRIAWSDFPGLREHMAALRPMFVANAQEATRGEALRHARQLGLFTSLRIPIVVGGELDRVLAVQWERIVPEPDPSVMAVLRRFADQAGLAIEQAARRRAQEETRALQAVTEALAAAATPAEVGRAIATEGLRALRAHAVTVYAMAEDGESLELVGATGYPDETLRRWERLALDAPGPVADAVRSGAVVECSSAAESAARYPGRIEEPFVTVPLVAAGRVIGGMLFALAEDRSSRADHDLVVSLARQAAQALDRAQLFERERSSAGRLLKLQGVTAALSQAVTLEDVSRTCLEHAVTAIEATEGLVVLRKPGADPSTSVLTTVAAIGLEAEEGEEVELPADAGAPVAGCLRGARLVAAESGWVAVALGAGALAVKRPPGRRLGTADREWLVTLASQGTQALDRAGRYETERAIAETMQRSVLPERLPEIAGVTLAARYLPGTAGVDVGGDWYDVIQLDRGRIGLVVGDVVGKGVGAAAMMGQLRNALRAFAFEHDDPREVVARLDRLVDGTMVSAFATLAYLVVDPAEHRVRYVLAGHPPPLHRRPDGTTRFLEDGRSLPIGVDASMPFTPGEAVLEGGSTILLYTDGLVERRGAALDEGLRRLAETAGASGDSPEELVGTVLDALVGDGPRQDDIAVLALRLATAAVESLRLVLPATQDGLVEMRDRLRSWLTLGNVESDEASDVVLAVWEACANAVEHAQQPSEPFFRVAGMLDESGLLRVEVEDSGRWKAGGGSTDRGLGLGLMRSLMDDVRVQQGEAGTRVALERRVQCRTVV